MKVFVIKTSDPSYHKIITIPNLETLLTICETEEIIILQINLLHKDDPKLIANLLDNVTLKEAKEISECKFMLEIYDDYRE